jgi:hypothetical protein
MPAPAFVLAFLLAGFAPSPTPAAGPSYAVVPSPIPGVPLPPEGAVDAELTRLRMQQADAERQQAFARLDTDRSLSAKEKAVIRGKLVLMKVAVMTTALPIDEVAAFYEKTVPHAEFLFGVRDLKADLEEGIRSGDIKADPARVGEAAGERGRSARWTREAERLSIAIEDHLIDPRDGRILKKTVVLVTSFEN